MEPIIAFLKRKLRGAGPALWERIAAECGVAKTLPRKIVYGDRENPGVATVQPLLTYFQDIEHGKRALPSLLQPSVPVASSAPKAAPTTERAEPRLLGVIGDVDVLAANAAIAAVACPLSALRERRGKKRRGVSATGPRRDAKPSADAERTRG